MATGLAVRRFGLDHAHPLVVECRCVIVVGDFSVGFAGGNLDHARLEMVDRLVEGGGRLVANKIHVFEVARVSAASVGKTVAVGSAVRVRAANEDVVFRNPRHFRPHAVGQHAGKPNHVDADDSDGDRPFAKDDRPHIEIAPLVVNGARPADSSRNGQKRIGRDHPLSRPHFNLRMERRDRKDRTHKQDRHDRQTETDPMTHGTLASKTERKRIAKQSPRILHYESRSPASSA